MSTITNHPYQNEASQIQALIDRSGGDSDLFVHALHQSKLAHISFSQIYAFETCPRQYYLRYVLGREIDPVPEYFIKGKALHQSIANAYRLLKIGKTFGEEVIYYNGINRSSQAGNHLRNGYLTFRQNMLPANEVFGIEKPFVFLLDNAAKLNVGLAERR